MSDRRPLDPWSYDPPQGVVSLMPGNTEILFAPGAGERLVGVNCCCDYPQEAMARIIAGAARATVASQGRVG